MRAVLCACLFALASCASDVGSTGLAIDDPLDLIDDITPGTLRLFVLPAGIYACESTTGVVTPEIPDVEQGMLEDAIADVTLDVIDSRARAEIRVAAGEYTVLVRGKGTDPVAMVPDTFIARGCASVTIGGGETQEIRITLVPDFGEGECGDGFLSPDEQCEDGNTMPGDGCSPACRTETIVLSTSSGAQDAPSLGGAPGRRWVSTFDSDGTTVHIRLLAPDGTAITSPSVLMMDAPLSGVLPTGVTGVHALSSVAVSNAGRVGVSFTTVPEIMVAFLDENRTPEGGAIEVSAAAGTGKRSRVAFAGDGTFLVVFEDDESTTGLSGIVFAAGSRSPGTPFPIGASAANEPAIAGAADHFVVAFASGGDVFVQRFSTDGSARDASPVAVLEDGSGTQDQPSVAALADGRVLVAWRDAGGDGAGTAIRARIFAADGAPDGAAFVVNSTTTGDQSAPSVAATGNVFVVAFESAGSVRARFISSDGSPVPNREQPPSTADFEVAAHGVQPSAAAGGVERANVLIAWAEGGDVRARAYPLR